MSDKVDKENNHLKWLFACMTFILYILSYFSIILLAVLILNCHYSLNVFCDIFTRVKKI